MEIQAAAIEEICSQRSDIAAYIDGELAPREEIELETHLAVCAECRDELNAQKKLLTALDFALENDAEITLPENFTRVVLANAESKVSGLRRPQERSKALFICAALFLSVLLGLGKETEAVFNTFANFAEQFLVVAGFVLHLFYDIAIGTAVILRSLGSQLIFNSSVSVALTTILFGISLLAFSRLVHRFARTD